MKRLVPPFLFIVTMASIVWSQTTARQAAPQAATATVRQIDEAAAQLSQLDATHARMMETNKKMAELQSELNDRITGVCRTGTNKVSPPETAKALGELCQMSMKFNMQYLQLQSQMQNENRQYTTVSNVMKTKHDTAKNSISNIR
jgi:cell division protein FtsB